MVINDLLSAYEAKLQDGILILCKLLNVDKSYIFTHGDRQVARDIENEFRRLVEKRILGHPIQYLLGHKEFMGLDFYLEEGVLVPRADTETLVDYIIKYIEDKYGQASINILDLGVGSGAISLSLAKYCRNVQLIGVDISDTAIRIANINRENLALDNVSFYQGDLFQALEGLGMENSFHIIISNPPYIPRADIEELELQVKDFEPRLALDGGVDGLDFYRRITPKSKEFLVRGGLLIYEIGYNQAEAVKDIMIGEGFSQLSILKDLQGHDRVVNALLKD